MEAWSKVSEREREREVGNSTVCVYLIDTL